MQILRESGFALDGMSEGERSPPAAVNLERPATMNEETRQVTATNWADFQWDDFTPFQDDDDEVCH